jgi:hypothetical protein
MTPTKAKQKKDINPKQLKQAREFGLEYNGIFEDGGLYYVYWKVHTSGNCAIHIGFHYNIDWELSLPRVFEQIYFAGQEEQEEHVFSRIHQALRIPTK